MRKIIVGAQVSLDGVMQAPGAATEDPTKGFTFGGWVMPYFDQRSAKSSTASSRRNSPPARPQDLRDLRRVLALPRRRRSPWRYRQAVQRHQEVCGFALRRGRDELGGSVLLRDIAAVKRLKQEDGPHLVTQGSTELATRWLANDLVDAMSIFTVPVVLGGGKSCSPTARRRTRSS